jgi:hypothetical protein
VCRRCGIELKEPRPTTINCNDCRSVERHEDFLRKHGINLAVLGDDEFVEVRKVSGVRRPVIVREAA